MSLLEIILLLGGYLIFVLSLCSSSPSSFALATPSTFVASNSNRRLNTRGIPYPDYRYVPWSALEADIQTDAANILGYTEATWNVPFTADIEFLSYSTIGLENPDQLQVLVDIGFDNETVYDCYVNHYDDYFWFEIIEAGAAPYFEALGWSQDAWVGNIAGPESEDKGWIELTDQERMAAENLCYFAETWAQIPIDQWSSTTTTFPTSTDSSSSGGNATGDEEGDIMISTIAPVDNVATLVQPENRFYLWQDLPMNVQDMATTMGYTESTWNTILKAPVELKAYDSLTTEERQAADRLGFGPEETYDCWIHHYEDYSWGELGAAGVQGYWITLNWTLLAWQGLVSGPEENALSYANLTAAEQEAVDQLCFFPETWDNLPFEEWVDAPDEGAEITLAPAPEGSESSSDEMFDVDSGAEDDASDGDPSGAFKAMSSNQPWATISLTISLSVVFLVGRS